MFKRRALIGAGVATLAFAAYIALAGPLNPPPGAVASTGPVQLSQALTPLPYTITTPGSYILTSNLTGVTGEHGIIIATSDVTIDLNGFRISGVGGSMDGIHLNTGSMRCTIRNGTIRAWGSQGIDGLTGGTDDIRIENVHVALCAGAGMRLGDSARVSSCTATNNTGTGIATSDASHIKDCIARGNGGDGISAGDRSIVLDCVATANGEDGIEITRSLVRGCMSGANTGFEIANPTPAESLLIDNHTLP